MCAKQPNPFNPQLPSTPEDFVGRTALLKAFEERLASTIVGSPMSMAIVGSRGIGKTSLLGKFHDIARRKGCLVVRFSPIEGNVKTIEDLCRYVISNMEQEAQKESKFKRLKEGLSHIIKQIAIEFSTDIGTFRLRNSSDLATSIQPRFRHALEKFWLEAQKDLPAVVIMIDEAESIPKAIAPFMFLREVFQRLGEGKNNYMLIVCGKLEFPEKLSGEFSPLLRFFHPEQLKPFDMTETGEYAISRLRRVGLDIDEKVIKVLYEVTEGQPYVLSAAMYILYRELPEEITKIEKTHFDAIRPELLAFIAKEFFYSLYYSTTPAARKILNKMSEIESDEIEFRDIVEHTKIKDTTLAPYLQELVRKGCVEKISRGRYRFFHKLFREYIFEREDIGPKIKPIIRRKRVQDGQITRYM